MNIYHAPPCVDCPPTAFGGNVSSSSNGVSATQGCPQRRRYGKGMVGLRAAVHAHPQAVPHRTAGVSCLVCHSSPKAGTATNDVTDGTHRTSTRPVHVQDQQAGSYGRQAWGDDGNVQNVYQKDGWQRDVVSTEGAEGLSEPPSARFGVDNAMHQHATRLQHSRQSGRHHQTSTTAPQGGSNSRLTRSTWDTGRHCSKDIGKDESDRVLTHALCCCHSFSQVMEVLHSHHDSQEALAGGAQGADMSERTLFPQQQQQQQQQQQRTQLESPSASTARLLTHLNGRHLAVLWITLARVKEEQEWRRSHPGTTHHQHPQTPPALWLLQKQPSQQQQQQQQHVQQVQSVSSPAHSSHHPYSSSTQPISQQHNLRAMPRQSGSSSSSATLSRGELVELRRLVALLERATLGYMASGVGDGDGGSDGRGAAPVFGSMLKQGRAAGAAGGVDADRRQPVSGHGASAVQSNTNGSGAMQQREDAGKRGGGSMNSSISSSNSVTSTSRSIELWSFQDMANTISAMGRLGHVPSQRYGQPQSLAC
ncbi:hypothetical protein DUNSADRAFT_7794 [Dunaliella salina]|uniref:Encoded protein n=1 Tax=Dunaliella salina TaxID=3046 RepID=A0ABQ7GKM6_DUNSA|nr:hypothetical protein DUNSADRAFT_7794 [Dunaliella salina]|eukprot:KAF5835165.1 hypothetical protein DUNSADRAFT_7794 [Dunaliella salina]